jgi:glucose/arabinose dehydrogenase
MMTDQGKWQTLGPALLILTLVVMLFASHILPYTPFSEPTINESYTIELVAEDLGGPSCLEWVDENLLIVCDRDNGRLVALNFEFNTTDSEWNLSSSSTWLDGFFQPHGIHFAEGFIIVSDSGRLTRINHSGPDSMWMDEVQTNERWVLIEGVSVGNHQTNAINEMTNGTLIWHVGSTCNICDEEDERNAALLWVNANTGEHGVLASGVRNSYDGVWVEGIGYLFSDNGRDWDGKHPLEEVNLLINGADYGWPDDDPEHPIPAGTIGPVATWTPHSSLNGMDVRPVNSTFPGNEYTVYATVFGSWNAVIPVGHEIVQIDFKENSTNSQGWTGEVTSFATNLTTPLPIAFHPSGNYLFYGTFSGGGSLHIITANSDLSD